MSYGPFHELMSQCTHVAALFDSQEEAYIEVEEVKAGAADGGKSPRSAGVEAQLAIQAVQEQARRTEQAAVKEVEGRKATEAAAAAAAQEEAAVELAEFPAAEIEASAEAVAGAAQEQELLAASGSLVAPLEESEGERAVRKADRSVERTGAEIAAMMETFKEGVPISVFATGQVGVVQSASTEGLVRVLLTEMDGMSLPKSAI